LQISLKNIKEREDPYQLFLDSIKNDETKRKYTKALYRFLKLIPNKIYEDTLGSVPQDQESNTLAAHFVHLAKKDAKLAQNIIAAFIKEEKKLVESGKMNANTLPNHIKPIKGLIEANAVALHWKSLHKLYPRPKQTEDRAYTRAELQQMIEASPELTDKLIVELFSSGGFRLEAWDYFTWKDVVFFKNKDGTFSGAALFVYRGDPESYWTFITPEACQTLEHYREIWKSEVMGYPKSDDPLIKTVRFPIVRRLNAFGVKRRLEKIVKKIGLRQPLPEGKRRHDVPLDHGFRKYFNTMMRRAKVNYLDKEDMMGHSVGLERYYERYQEDDFERFPEYQKAIPFLTISDTERIRLENQQLEEEKSELERKNEENQLQQDEVARQGQAIDTLMEELKKLKESKSNNS